MSPQRPRPGSGPAAPAAAAAGGRGQGRRDALEVLLVVLGGALVALPLTGLVLSGAGVRLDAGSWAVALGGLGVVGGALLAVGLRARRAPVQADVGQAVHSRAVRIRAVRTRAVRIRAVRTRAVRIRAVRTRAVRPLLASLPWLALAGGVAAAAVSTSSRATERAEVAPVALALQSVEGPLARILVLSDESVGPFELRTDPGEGATLSYPLFTVGPGRPVTSEVVVPLDGRVVITLHRPGSTRPLRSLTLSR